MSRPHNVLLPGGASTRGSHCMGAARYCERMFALRYIWRWVSKDNPDYRHIGTLVHLCLAYYYASLMPPAEQPRWYNATSLDQALEEEGAGRPDLCRLAKMILVTYIQAHQGEPVRPIAIEEEYAVRIGDLDNDPNRPYPELDDELVTCRVDMLCQIKDKIWIVDFKCSGDARRKDGKLSKWKEDGEYALDWQVLMNLHIIRKCFPDWPIAGFVIQRIKRIEPFDFDRHPLTIPGLAYQEAPRVARQRIHEEMVIRDKVARGEKPGPSFHACQGRYGPCDYRPLCLASNENTRLVTLHRDYDWLGEKESATANAA